MSLVDYYAGRTIFVAGGSGFVGTALIYKLVKSCNPGRIYCLCRGSPDRLWEKWNYILQPAQYETLRASNLIFPIVGDASLPNCGLDLATISMLQQSCSVVYNLASKIRIVARLSDIKTTDIYPALRVAELAMTFPHCERFVWASSAYANGLLHWADPQALSTTVGEEFYEATAQGAPETELQEIEAGRLPEVFKQNFFSSEYAYAKHLTERLLQQYHTSGRLRHLLIIRPSCVGPALHEPFQGYEVMGSAPITTMMSHTIHRSTSAVSGGVVIPTRHDLRGNTHINECPVDILVNRMLAHTSVGTVGPVHAVAGGGRLDQILRLQDYWDEYMNHINRMEPRPTVNWINDEALFKMWRGGQGGKDGFFMTPLGPMPRGFAFLGASFLFEDSKSLNLWEQMRSYNQQDANTFPCTVQLAELQSALITRRVRTSAEIAKALHKSGFISPPEGGSGVFDGMFDRGFFLQGAADAGMQTAGDVATIPLKIMGGVASVMAGRGLATHRFPHSGPAGPGSPSGQPGYNPSSGEQGGSGQQGYKFGDITKGALGGLGGFRRKG